MNDSVEFSPLLRFHCEYKLLLLTDEAKNVSIAKREFKRIIQVVDEVLERSIIV